MHHLHRRSSRFPVRRCRLDGSAGRAVEMLEGRTLLSAVVVTNPGDAAVDGQISLRDAIAIANSATDPTTITFDPAVFSAAQTITLNGTQLELSNTSQPVTITGPAAGLTISQNNVTRGLVIDSGVTATLSDLTISNCTAGVGGAISNSGNLTLSNSTLSNNDATTNDDGGGLANYGAAVLINDTLANNIGDGIDQRGGTLMIVNCTISGNSSYGGYSGGGIYVQGGSATTISNTVIAANTCAVAGGPDVFGPFVSLGNNLVGATDGSTGWISSDLTGSVASLLNPDLGSLANNGGPTATLLPLNSSPALRAGSVSLIPAGTTTDQRGFARVVKGTVDIGSVESGATRAIHTPAEKIGGLDLTFGANGLAGHNVGFVTTNGLAEDGAQSVLVGTIGTAPGESFGVTRYNADGSVDTTFGSGGVTSTSFGGTDDVPSAVVVLGGGKILVAGTAITDTSGVATGSEFAVAQYNADGSIDTSFGGGSGQVLVSFSSNTATLSNDVLKSVAIGSGGVIYLGGSTDAGGTTGTDFALAALNADGSADTAFGGGKVHVDFAGGDDVINSMAMQANGDIVTAGAATVGGAAQIALARFLPTGVIDKHFGTLGTVTTNVRSVYDSASSVVIQPRGQIIVGGVSATGSGSTLSSDFVVARYTAAGRIDRTFGGGPVVTSFAQPSAVTQLVIQANGAIIASGKTAPSLANIAPDQLNVAVARFTIRGTLDTTFDSTGKAIIDLGVGVVSTGAQLAASGQTQIQPLDTTSDVALLNQLTQSDQGVVAVTPGGEILVAGNSGANTTEGELVVAGVDLQTTLLTQPPTAVTGGARGTVSVQIVETGTAQATGTVTIDVEIATDAQGDGGTSVKSAAQRINLRAQQSRTYRIAFVYPSSLTTGNYYLVVNVLNGDAPALKDLNADNNLSASNNAVSIAPPDIMLDGAALSAASTFTAGKPATVTFTLTNDGNVLARGATTVDLFLSPDQTLADGTSISTSKVAVGLAAGKPRTYRLKVKLPSTVTAGKYYLIAVIDPANSLGAIDTTNSTLVDSTQLTVG